MDHLHPARYNLGYAASSTSSMSTLSPNGYAPSLSEPDSDAKYAGPSWQDYGTDQHQQGLSPLEILMQRGQQVQQDILTPRAANTISAKSKIYARAAALSRKTTIKHTPIQPSPDLDDDNRSVISIDLHGSTSGFASSRNHHSPNAGLPYPNNTDNGSFGPQRFHDDASSSSPAVRTDSPLLANAFRNSVASDISFNSITDQIDRMSIVQVDDDPYAPGLSRRASMDTVRSSEFGEDGRWAKAWADQAEDDDSMYEGSSYGDDHHPNRLSILSKQVEIDPSHGAYGTAVATSGGGLHSIAEQWKARQTPTAVQGAAAQLKHGNQFDPRIARSVSPLPQIQSAPAIEHVVNLTRSAQAVHLALPQAEHRYSHIPKIQDADADSDTDLEPPTPRSNQPFDPNFIPTAQPQLGHHQFNNDPTTLFDSNRTAHVFVYPPSPSGSEASRSSRGGLKSSEPLSEGSSAIVETMSESPQQAAIVTPSPIQLGDQPLPDQTKSTTLPVAPFTLLSRPPANTPILGPNGRRPSKHKTSGHPTGRPPPPPPNHAAMTHGGSLPGYFDPNRASPDHANRPTLGRMRSEALARADGRESIVSDLDVVTLRLNASSRRDSSSTISSVMTSRMSVGTVRYEDIGLPPAEGQASHRDLTTESGGDPRQNYGPTGGHLALYLNAPSRSDNLPPMPRRALTTPTEETDNERHYYLHRSNTHPARIDVWPPNGPSQQPHLQTSDVVQKPGLQQMTSFASLSAATNPSAANNQGDRPALRMTKSTTQIGTTSSSATPFGSVAMKALASDPLSDHVSIMRKPIRGYDQTGTDTRTGPSSAEDFLSQGITYHEQGDLSRSAFYFERSAKVEGGCVVGMCMFGMALREGWGAKKDTKKGFEWIQRAAAKAGEMMQSGGQKKESELKAIKSELKLSVYELGKCFCYGWGIKMDKHMALEYFELAAKLGDPDAQAEAGALYAAGKGCKKDLKKAAMYYRMAEDDLNETQLY